MTAHSKSTDRTAINAAHDKVLVFNGPLAKVYSCPFCTFHAKLPKTGMNRIRGRIGWLNHSAGAKSKTAAHILREHRDKLCLPVENTP